MGTRSLLRLCLACATVICLASLSKLALAEGSRNLYPASYPATGIVADGARANLDLQTGPNNIY
ncbi:MAG: hypothetical protein H6987_17465, partial [Pseudomonadales bacterium]|nr:hypothetical protein [Pseudomonadales bacterium]